MARGGGGPEWRGGGMRRRGGVGRWAVPGEGRACAGMEAGRGKRFAATRADRNGGANACYSDSRRFASLRQLPALPLALIELWQVCTVRKESVTDDEGIFWVLRPPIQLYCFE